MAVLAQTTLEPIREKVLAGERLDFDDGVALLESDDLLALGELADLARRERGGTDEVFFVQNLYVNQTNVCRVKCKFCAFAATRKQEHAYTLTAEELVEDVLRQREVTGFTEIHMVNGENPHVDFAFYRDTMGMRVTKQNWRAGVVFLSADPESVDHEIALMAGRPDPADPHLINQISMRVGSLDDLRVMRRRLVSEGYRIEGVVNHASTSALPRSVTR